MAGPLTKIEFAPGVIKDDSPLGAEGSWIDADKVRFKQGRAETIGGWTALSGGSFSGIVRGAHAWADLSGAAWEAFGTASNLYVESGGTTTSILGNHSEGTLAGSIPGNDHVNIGDGYTNVYNTSPIGRVYVNNTVSTSYSMLIPTPSSGSFAAGYYFTVDNSTSSGTVLISMGAAVGTIDGGGSKTLAALTAYKITYSGSAWTTSVITVTQPFSTTSGSTTVTVTHAQHGLTVGSVVTFSNGASVGGLSMNGARTVTAILSGNQYTFTHGSSASSTAVGGAPVDYVVAFASGNVNGSSSTRPRVWSLDNFGEYLVAVPNKGGGGNGGGLYEWQPATSWPELTTTTYVGGTGWTPSSSGGTKTAGTAANLSQNVSGVLVAGKTYRITFTASVSAGTVQFGVNAGTPTAAVIGLGAAVTTSGSYSRLFRCPANPSDIVFTGDSAFAGTISSVSIKLENKAYRIPEAPAASEAMFVDPHGHVVLLGSVEADGDYNPMLVRWCDQANNRSWVPDSTNLAGEEPLQGGGRLVGGVAARGVNVLGSDAAFFSMVYTGQSSSVFAINPIGTSCGLIGRNAITEHNGRVFWWSNNGNLYISDGSSAQVMDCRLRRDVMTNIAANQGDKVFCAPNPAFSEFWAFYPDSRDGTECSRYIATNWTEQGNWTCGTFAISAWIPQGVFTTPRAFWTSGTIMQHETGNSANGSALSWYIESGYFDIADGDRLLAITKLVPDADDQVGSVTYQFTTRGYPNASDIVIPSKTATTSTQELNFRFMARQAKLRISGSATATFWRMGLLRLGIQKTGAGR